MSSASACGASRDRVGWAARSLIALVDAYRVTLAPLLGGHCRFWPSCSQYAQEAVALHGALAGSRLAVARLLRCQPFHQGGFDPVPAPTERRPGTAPGGRSHSRS